jgi:hypothetical protein
MKAGIAAAVVVLGLVAVAAPGSAQTEAETTIEVPELRAFHEVIFPLWHRAYPERDTAMLRALWPDLQRNIAAVEKAELPGILRDKKAAWEKGLQRLRNAGKAYGEALASGGVQEKLRAAEDMHSSYEGLVRAIWPVIPELASFHEVLYRIYHYYLPNKDDVKLRECLSQLQARMGTLTQAVLPKRLAGSQAKFEARRSALGRKVELVVKAVPRGDWKQTKLAVEDMHTAYKDVEAIFE